MKHEEIDQLLAELPHIDAQQAQPAPAKRTGGPMLAAYRAMVPVAPVAPDAIERARQRAREEARERHREELRAKRAKLERRPIHPRLLQQLRATQTPCALLLGPTGTGKTTAMDWIALRWRGHFAHAREIASAERRHGLGEGYPQALQRARETPVLYLDDVGAEEPRDLGTLQELIDYRYRHGLAIVATAGFSISDLNERLGKPYVRRLVDQHVRRFDDSEWPVLIVNLFQGQALRSVT